MEEGTVRKNTIFVGGLTEDVDEAALLEHFCTFGIYSFLGRYWKLMWVLH